MHIRPWEVDLMTYQQFEDACAAIDEYARKMNEGSDA